MKIFKKIIVTAAILFGVMQPLFASTAFAQFTILPSAAGVSDEECKDKLWQWESRGGTSASQEATTSSGTSYTAVATFSQSEIDVILGCAIRTGKISLSMIPYFVKYFANFLLSIVGVICMLFIVIGGYWYIFGGLTDQKEKGKKFIGNALKGMVVAILSWVIVSVIINVITS
jgi:hypothetical protein